MSYAEILQLIYGRGRFGMRPGLERILPVLERLGNPQKLFPVVHVVGTNGKGSTASFLSSILAAAGYRVGLFTSPHLVSFTERIRVDGAEITEEAVTELAGRVLAAASPETTFFELVTALGFLHFAGSGVDIAVVEAGMGGRHDATSAAPGILSVIAPIGLDHAAYLGETVAEIAAEKLGIVAPGEPVVVSAQPPEALAVIAERCRTLGSEPRFLGTDFTARWTGGLLDYRGIGCSIGGMTPGIPGRYQRENAAAALAAAEVLRGLGFRIDPESLRRGIETASWPGRMELFSGPPRILLDGAHNPAGAIALAEALGDLPREKLFLVTGAMADKDITGILAPVAALAACIFTVTPAVPAALPSSDLCRLCSEHGFPAVDAVTAEEGLRMACAEAGPDDLIVVAGSLYLVGETRALLLHRHFEPCRG